MINQVFKFISDNRNYKLSLGVITSKLAGKTILAWGAIDADSDDIWVPELDDIKHSWSDAQWTSITQHQAALFDSAYQRDFSHEQTRLSFN
ncbi:MAG: hypothetical protein P8X79_05690 [Reinekea sp.]